MPKPNPYATHNQPDLQLVQALQTLLAQAVALDLRGTRIAAHVIWSVLLMAATQQTSIEQVTQTWPAGPSGNRVREVVQQALPPVPQLQTQLNRVLRAQLPPSLLCGKHSYEVALDLTLIPYHGQPAHQANEIMRSAPKNGTTHFHGYASAAIVHHQQRYVVAFCFVTAGTPMVALVRQLLNRVRRLGIRLKLVLLDKGFYAAAVFRTLDRRHLTYIVPMRLGARHRLFRQRGSYRTTHRLAHAQDRPHTLQAVLLRRFPRRRDGRRRLQWQGYACGGCARHWSFHRVHNRYRYRFGIETSYRQMHEVRARTSTRQPGLRLLYLGLAFVLLNAYVTWRKGSAGRPPFLRRPANRTLPHLAHQVCRLLEANYGVLAFCWAFSFPTLS